MNEQKEITYIEARKMTLEQLEKITPEQKAKLLEEKARYMAVENGSFIQNRDYVNFLAQQGYKLEGYKEDWREWDNKSEWFYPFKADDSYKPRLGNALILLGDENEISDYVADCQGYNIVNNPFIKYVSVSNEQFLIFKIVENPNASWSQYDDYEPLFEPELEKDLSREWIKYLVSICPEYIDIMIEHFEDNIQYTNNSFESETRLIAKRIQELKQQEKDIKEDRDKRIKDFNEEIEYLKSLQGELQA